MFGENESASVDVSLTDVGTDPNDHADYVQAIQDAVDAYPGPGMVTLSGTTITFTAAADGDVMTPLVVDLPLTDDGLTEGPEDFSLDLTNANSSTGANVGVDPTAASATTTINDTIGDGGTPDVATWAIVGSDSVQEGGLASYRLSLDGTIQAGEEISIELGLSDLDTDSADYSALVDAIEASVAGRPDLNFDPVTGAITFTAPVDGTMEDIVISVVANADGEVEVDEDFVIALSNPTSATGSDVATDPIATDVMTTIVSADAPAQGPHQNNPPIASDDTADTLVDQPVDGNLFGNDGDPEGDAITVVDPVTGVAATGSVTVTTASGGMVVIDPTTGDFTYTPDLGFVGADGFEYEIVDPSGNVASAYVSLNVISDQDPLTNNEPDANDDAVVTQVNTPAMGNALANDSDVNGESLVVTEIDGVPVVAGVPTAVLTPSGGTLEIGDDGAYVYTPDPGFVGTESITYTVDDGMGGTDTATIHLSVFNTPPEVEDDINTTSVNEPVDGNVLTNDSSDPDEELVVGDGSGNPIAGPTTMATDEGGEIVINPDGTYTYTPATDFVGEDTITIEVCDEFGACEEAELSIEVRDPDANPGINNNAPPIVGDDSFQVFVDTPITSSLLGNDSDPDGDVLTVTTTPVTEPTFGTVVINPNGTFTYTPDPDFIGEDTFEYEVCDPAGECDTAVVTIDVQPDPDPDANDAPNANDDSVSAQKNDPVSGDLLANDTDPNGDPLTVTTTPVSGPSNGTVVINPNGTFEYTPDDDFVGNDSFVYEVCDADGACEEATVYVTVFDQPPVAVDDFNNTIVDTPVSGNVLSNDSDPNTDDDLMVTMVDGQPIGNGPIVTDSGTVTIFADGSYTYEPLPGQTGIDTYTYTVVDEAGNEALATVTIEIRDPGTIDGTGTPPVANDDAASGFVDTPIEGDLLSNDGDPNGNPLTINETPVVDPTNGTVVINPDGTFEYTPDPGFVGTDTFEYEICNASGACDTATVTLNVLVDSNGPANDPPFANDDAGIGQYNEPIVGDLLANDSDPEGDPLTVNTTPVVDPTNGTVVINPKWHL